MIDLRLLLLLLLLVSLLNWTIQNKKRKDVGKLLKEFMAQTKGIWQATCNKLTRLGKQKNILRQ